MSQPPPPERPEPPTKRSRGDNATAIIISVIRFFTTLVDRFGWPGAALFALGTAIQLWSTPEQKHDMVDMYVLGKGMYSWWPLAAPTIISILLVWAQRLMNKREVRKIKEEMKRVGTKKSELQEKLSGRRLRHRKDDAEI
jgi:hypothetical protein